MLFTFQHSSVSNTLQMTKIMFYISFMKIFSPWDCADLQDLLENKKKKNAANVKQSVTHGSLPHVLVSSKKHNVPQSAVPFCCFGPLHALTLKHCRRQHLQIVKIQDLGL